MPDPRSESSLNIRLSIPSDVPAIRSLIERSARELSPDYTSEQVEAALQGAFGVDSQLIADETYYVIESEGVLAAAGGWSKRATLFGGDAYADRTAELLNPATDPARIRAFFVSPDFARRGIGRLLLKTCEDAARDAGFRTCTLMATLPGVRLYTAAGYHADEPVEYDLGSASITFVPMLRSIGDDLS